MDTDDYGRDRLRSRFTKGASKSAQQFLASISFDRRLYRQDIAGSIAHAQMLSQRGIISEEDSALIVSGLTSICDEIERGAFEFTSESEDVHMAIEGRLFEKIGGVAGKLHTARSRNDQVALDLRLFMKEAIAETVKRLRDFQRTLVKVAEAHQNVIMPGYTHLQQAQPVLFVHHLLAYLEMAQRDIERLQDSLRRTDVLPLGSGALAGVPYPVARDLVARKLDFSEVSHNSLDAVSDRDFVIEYEAAAAITMMHLSRFAEEIILWSSAEFGFVEIDDAYATSSSIMPQKKNPDVAELTRGKTGRVYGNLFSLLTAMKGLPLAYNRDMQEDKEGLFDTVDTLLSSLDVFTGLVGTMKVSASRMRDSMAHSYILATDLADYLVAKGLSFRQAHSVVGKLVQYAFSGTKSFQQLSLDEYRRFSSLFERDVYDISLESSVAARNVGGGTAPEQVAAALARARDIVNAETGK